MAAIESAPPRGGRKPQINAAEIVRLTTQTTPEGATYWSTRKLGKQMGISDTAVRKVWKANGLRPHLVETFNVSRDPKFVEKLEDGYCGVLISPRQNTRWHCTATKKAKCGHWTEHSPDCR